MIQTAPFEQHTAEYEKWFDQYSEVYESELLAIKQQLSKLPRNIRGIEVGLGTGRFSAPLGIKEGVEPASNMRKIAVQRGIEVMDATAEHLPYKDLHFDFVLFVTICYLKDVRLAFKEANRVLKNKGSVIIGFIDMKSPLAERYMEKRRRSTFYQHADFYTTEKVLEMLKESGFKQPEIVQTIFSDIDQIKDAELPREGHGEGSFVVIRAVK